MADKVFNIAKGRVAELANLALANDALIGVILKLSGLEADSVLEDYATLATLLAAANDECDFTGYSRKTISGIAVTPDNTNNRQDVTATNLTSYTNSGGSSQAAGKLLVCYDNDTTGGTDANIIPLTMHDCALTFDVGVATQVNWNASGFFRAA